jgi:hypothetical protein
MVSGGKRRYSYWHFARGLLISSEPALNEEGAGVSCHRFFWWISGAPSSEVTPFCFPAATLTGEEERSASLKREVNECGGDGGAAPYSATIAADLASLQPWRLAAGQNCTHKNGYGAHTHFA